MALATPGSDKNSGARSLAPGARPDGVPPPRVCGRTSPPGPRTGELPLAESTADYPTDPDR